MPVTASRTSAASVSVNPGTEREHLLEELLRKDARLHQIRDTLCYVKNEAEIERFGGSSLGRLWHKGKKFHRSMSFALSMYYLDTFPIIAHVGPKYAVPLYYYNWRNSFQAGHIMFEKVDFAKSAANCHSIPRLMKQLKFGLMDSYESLMKFALEKDTAGAWKDTAEALKDSRMPAVIMNDTEFDALRHVFQGFMGAHTCVNGDQYMAYAKKYNVTPHQNLSPLELAVAVLNPNTCAFGPETPIMNKTLPIVESSFAAIARKPDYWREVYDNTRSLDFSQVIRSFSCAALRLGFYPGIPLREAEEVADRVVRWNEYRYARIFEAMEELNHSGKGNGPYYGLSKDDADWITAWAKKYAEKPDACECEKALANKIKETDYLQKAINNADKSELANMTSLYNTCYGSSFNDELFANTWLQEAQKKGWFSSYPQPPSPSI